MFQWPSETFLLIVLEVFELVGRGGSGMLHMLILRPLPFSLLALSLCSTLCVGTGGRAENAIGGGSVGERAWPSVES